MQIEEFERQQKSATRPANNATTIMALIDAFLLLPCAEEELDKAKRMREDWAKMKSQGENWNEWSTRDLERLMSVMLVMHNILGETVEVLSLFIVARKLQGKK